MIGVLQSSSHLLSPYFINEGFRLLAPLWSVDCYAVYNDDESIPRAAPY